MWLLWALCSRMLLLYVVLLLGSCVFHFDCAYLVLLREVFDRHRQLLEVFGRRLLLLARWIAAERWLALSAKRAEPLGHYLRRMKESAYSSRSA